MQNLNVLQLFLSDLNVQNYVLICISIVWVGSVLLIFVVFGVVFYVLLSSLCVLCAEWCLCLWIHHTWLPFRFSPTFYFAFSSFNWYFFIHKYSLSSLLNPENSLKIDQWNSN
jgi:hypothetical protein